MGKGFSCAVLCHGHARPCHLVTLGTGVGGDTTEDFAYDAPNRLSREKDDDSTVNLNYGSLSRVLTEVQGSNPLGTPLRAKHASRESEARRAGHPQAARSGKSVSYPWNAESARTKIG